MYSYVNLAATVLNCHLPTTRHINFKNYIGLSWHSSLITLLCLQLMVCFTHISRKNRNWVKNRSHSFLWKPDRNQTRNGIVEP